jgi:uncharacterized protein (TIGR04255 family)
MHQSHLKEVFFPAVSSFLEIYKLQANRVGLRYVNNLTIENKETLDWESLIQSKLLSLFTFYPDPKKVSRVFNNLELNLGDFNLRFQYGMHNPDFPAPIKKRNFILDYDAYSSNLQDLNDITRNLDKFHQEIQNLFEICITDELRGIMNA